MQSRVLEHRQLQVPCSCHTLLCVSSCRLLIAILVFWTQQLGPQAFPTHAAVRRCGG